MMGVKTQLRDRAVAPIPTTHVRASIVVVVLSD